MTTRPTLCLHAGVGWGQASKPHQQCTGWRGGAGLSAPQKDGPRCSPPRLGDPRFESAQEGRARGAGGSQGRQDSAHYPSRRVQYLALDPGHSAQLRASCWAIKDRGLKLKSRLLGNSGLDTRTEKTRRNVVPLSIRGCGQGWQRLNRCDCKIAHSGSSGTP